MKVYRGGDGWRGGPLRVFGVVALGLLVLAMILLVYLLLPFGAQRAVLLGSDARGPRPRALTP